MSVNADLNISCYYHIIRTVATFTVSICPGVMSCGMSIE